MVILPSSLKPQTAERTGVRDLPESALGSGLTSVPLPERSAGAGVVGGGVAGACKRSCPLPISLNKRMFLCGCTTPDPWQANHDSVNPGTNGACDHGVDGATAATPGAAGAGTSPKPESPAGDVGVGA